MDLKLAGKTGLITGSSRGIGLATAKAFAAAKQPVNAAPTGGASPRQPTRQLQCRACLGLGF